MNGAWARLVPRVDLSDAAFAARHRALVGCAWATLLLVVGVAVVNRDGREADSHHLSHGNGEVVMWTMVAVQLAATVLAGLPGGTRRGRSIPVAVSLMTGSIALVHAGGGLTDLHFAFFVGIALIGLYQDAVPFVVAVVITALHHLVFGLIDATEVFSDPAAEKNPVPFALMHTGFVLAACAVQVAQWRFAERAQTEAHAALNIERNQGEQRLALAAQTAELREQEAVRSAASRADETTAMAGRLDTVLTETARTGERIGEEAVEAISGIRSALDRITTAAAGAAADVDRALGDSAAAREVIGSLERSVAEISSVAQLISAVAEQTNLLALNATIEAARAGEAGRGFGIVADEVKSLAAETATATSRIEETVGDVRTRAEAVAAAVAAVGSVLDRVAEAQRQVTGIVEDQGAAVSLAQESLAAAAREVAGAAAAARAQH